MKTEFKVKKQILLDLREAQEYGLDETNLDTEQGVAQEWDDCRPDFSDWFDEDFGDYEDERIPYSLYTEEYYVTQNIARQLPDSSWIRFKEFYPTNDLCLSELYLNFEDYDVHPIWMVEEVTTVRRFGDIKDESSK